MTAFTDDLDNDLEVLTEHHDVTAVKVAKAAFAQVPEDVRLPLLRTLLGMQLVDEDPHPAEVIEPYSQTGLPQKLRGAIHELGRTYPRNLVVDAAMLEMPEEHREAVARTFLPKKPLREKLDEIKAGLYTVVDVGSGEELGKTKNVSQHLRILDGKTGQPMDYILVRIVSEYDFRKDEAAEPRKLALYRKVTAE